LSIYKVSPKEWVERDILIPTSKSFANRILILAALSSKDIEIKHLPPSSDVKTMLRLFREIGLNVIEELDSVTIKGSFPACEKEESTCHLDTGDGGTTNRFILGMLSRGKRKYILKAEGHMLVRPMKGLVHVLESLGTSIYRDKTGQIHVQGKEINEGKYLVDCSETTQYLSSLLLSYSNVDKVCFETVELSSSSGYVGLTENIVANFYNNNKSVIYCPIDSSSLSYPLALSCLHGKLTLRNCHEIDPFQADSIIIDHLKSMGAKISLIPGVGLVCQKSVLKGIDFDGGQCPDIVPTLAFLASFATGETKISNIEILRHKECDRIASLLSILKSFDVKHIYKNEILHIWGHSRKITKEVNLEVPADHRMVMIGALFLYSHSGGSINNSHHIAKSYPSFFKSLIE